jgi:hypothetical protein
MQTSDIDERNRIVYYIKNIILQQANGNLLNELPDIRGRFRLQTDRTLENPA